MVKSRVQIASGSYYSQALRGSDASRSRSSVRRDQLLLIVAILINTGIWIFTPHEDPEVGSPISQVTLGVVYLAAIAGFYFERERTFPLALAAWPISLLVVLGLFSTLWSDEAFTTFRRAFEYAGMTALTLYFVCRLGLRVFVETFAWAIASCAAISLPLILFVKDVGLMSTQYVGSWRGIFVHKNSLGMAMVVGMVTVFCAIQGSYGVRRLFWRIAFGLMALLLIGSESITAVGAGIAVVVIGWMLFRCRSTRSPAPAIILASIIGLIIIVSLLVGFGPEELLGLAGRDVTLTGRTAIWSIILDSIADRPFLGYGYKAYFVNHVLNSGWDPGHAHNGLLEAALNFGLVGVAIIVAAFAIGIARSWIAFWSSSDRFSAWPLLIMVFTIATNFTEDSIDSTDFRQLAFVAAVLFGTLVAYRKGATGAKARGLGSLVDESESYAVSSVR